MISSVNNVLIMVNYYFAQWKVLSMKNDFQFFFEWRIMYETGFNFHKIYVRDLFIWENNFFHFPQNLMYSYEYYKCQREHIQICTTLT